MGKLVLIMRRIAPLLIYMLIYSAFIYAQDFRVLDAKRSYKINGIKIRTGDRLSQEEIVIIKEKGLLTLDINYPRNLRLEAGRYRLDSLIEALKIRYARHKKHFALLELKNLNDCKFIYKIFIVPGSNNHYEADRIRITGEKLKSSKNELTWLDVSWENPDNNYQGTYLIIIQESFGQELLIDVTETEYNFASINLDKYDDQFMQYSIKAEDCRASRIRKIR